MLMMKNYQFPLKSDIIFIKLNCSFMNQGKLEYFPKQVLTRSREKGNLMVSTDFFVSYGNEEPVAVITGTEAQVLAAEEEIKRDFQNHVEHPPLLRGRPGIATISIFVALCCCFAYLF
jgi:hypothetical protein